MKWRYSVVAATLLGIPCCVIIPISSRRPIPQALRAHPRGLRSLAFSRDGKVLASASQDGPVILWDVESQQPIGPPIVAERRGLRAVSLSPDAAVLAVGNEDGTVVLWDTRNPQPKGRALAGRHQGAVTSVAFSPDGRALASGSNDGTVIFWDVQSGKEIDRLASGDGGVGRVLFSPDGSAIAVATSHAITLRDATNHRPLGPSPLRTEGGLEELAFSADGGFLARSGGRFSLWDVAGQQCIWGGSKDCDVVNLALDDHAGVAISPDGRLLALGARGGEGVVELWDIASQDRMTVLKGHGGKRWAIAVALTPEVTGGGALTSTRIHATAFSPDGHILVSGGDDGAIIFWDMDTRKPIPPAGPRGTR